MSGGELSGVDLARVALRAAMELALITERAWELPAAGASLRERWAAIAPQLAGHVPAIGYAADTGRLTVCPEPAAWATKLPLEQARVIEAANESAGRTVVRALRILAPGSVHVPELDDVAPDLRPRRCGRCTSVSWRPRATAKRSPRTRPSRPGE
ncbi:DUF721 domain-containing protein [Streptomyces sp. NPDC053069]|uniref:DUF721 domain-containing protein n=1 Tax=Streptomyces sp. NPDC053069 TaxID=3365695 RepID=UPI0037D306CE